MRACSSRSVKVGFARQLERELSAALARSDALHAENERTIKELHKCDDECMRLTIERDAARTRAGDLTIELAEAQRQLAEQAGKGATA